MGEIKTAQQRMEARCQENMDMIRDIVENHDQWTWMPVNEIKETIRHHQSEIKECIDINVLNRRIRSCSR